MVDPNSGIRSARPDFGVQFRLSGNCDLRPSAEVPGVAGETTRCTSCIRMQTFIDAAPIRREQLLWPQRNSAVPAILQVVVKIHHASFGRTALGQAGRLKQLQHENARLNRLMAHLTLDKTMLQDILSRKFLSPCTDGRWSSACMAPTL